MIRYLFGAFLLRRCSSDRRRWTQSLIEDLTASRLAALRKIPVRSRNCRILEADGAANLSPVAAPKPDQSERDQNHQASTAPRFLAVWEMGDFHWVSNSKCSCKMGEEWCRGRGPYQHVTGAMLAAKMHRLASERSITSMVIIATSSPTGRREV